MGVLVCVSGEAKVDVEDALKATQELSEYTPEPSCIYHTDLCQYKKMRDKGAELNSSSCAETSIDRFLRCALDFRMLGRCPVHKCNQTLNS